MSHFCRAPNRWNQQLKHKLGVYKTGSLKQLTKEIPGALYLEQSLVNPNNENGSCATDVDSPPVLFDICHMGLLYRIIRFTSNGGYQNS